MPIDYDSIRRTACKDDGRARWGEQECWDPDTEAGQFLKTPLLDELKALKKLLMAPVSDQAALAMLTPRRAQQPYLLAAATLLS